MYTRSGFDWGKRFCFQSKSTGAGRLAVRQACPRLEIGGGAAIDHPARPNDDLAKLQAKGVKVYVVQEDLDARGIVRARCVSDAQPVSRRDVADLMEAHDQVWHW